MSEEDRNSFDPLGSTPISSISVNSIAVVEYFGGANCLDLGTLMRQLHARERGGRPTVGRDVPARRPSDDYTAPAISSMMRCAISRGLAALRIGRPTTR